MTEDEARQQMSAMLERWLRDLREKAIQDAIAGDWTTYDWLVGRMWRARLGADA